MKTKAGTLILFAVMALTVAFPANMWSQQKNDYYTVKGVVKDKNNQRTLEYASISVAGTNIGTITNTNGEFSLKIKDSLKAKAIEVSHIGYFNARYPLEGKDAGGVTIYLTSQPNLLDEITIRAVDARELVQKAIERVPANYDSDANVLSAFYRETVRKRRNYINVSEAVIDIYKSPYDQGIERDLLQIYKGRRLISPSPDDTLMVKLLGGPHLSIYLDLVKNDQLILNADNLHHYKFFITESVMINERPHYVVNFEPRVVLPYALHYGKLFIDRESLTFSRAEFSVSMDDRNKATQAILRKKPLSLRFKPEEISFLVTYNQRDGLSHLHYIRSEIQFKCDWKRRLFSTNYSIVSETVITGKTPHHGDRIPARLAFRNTYSLSDKVANFMDPHFWEDYNIIEPDESLENAVNRLKKSNLK